MVAGANSQGHQITLNRQTVGGQFIAGAHGSTTAGPVWGDAMKAVEKYLPNATFHAPDPLSIRGQSITVPTLYGVGIQQAAQSLRTAGFTPVVGPTVNSGNPADTVAFLSPGSGSTAPSGSTVTIYVSNGTPSSAPTQPTTPAQGTGGNGGNGNRGQGNGNGNGGNGRGR
jgi:hypothetical protein